MKENFENWKKGVETLLRKKKREKENIKSLTKDEEEEEIQEYERMRTIFYSKTQKTTDLIFSNVILLISRLFLIKYQNMTH